MTFAGRAGRAADRLASRERDGGQPAAGRLAGRVKSEAQAYADGEERPLGSFLVLMGGYSVVVGGMTAYLAATGRELPERLGWSDLGLVAVATHKLSRLLAKDPVTSPLRAPFTRFAGTSGPAELADEVRGRGLRKALGELVTCPFCLGMWVATAGVFGLIAAPRTTRAAASVLAVVTAADVLQFGYAALEQTDG